MVQHQNCHKKIFIAFSLTILLPLLERIFDKTFVFNIMKLFNNFTKYVQLQK